MWICPVCGALSTRIWLFWRHSIWPRVVCNYQKPLGLYRLLTNWMWQDQESDRNGLQKVYRKVMECYYISNATQIGYRRRMYKLWIKASSNWAAASSPSQPRRKLSWKKSTERQHRQPKGRKQERKAKCIITHRWNTVHKTMTKMSLLRMS